MRKLNTEKIALKILFIRYLIKKGNFDVLIDLLNKHKLKDDFFEKPAEDWLQELSFYSFKIFYEENICFQRERRKENWYDVVSRYRMIVAKNNRLEGYKEKKNSKFIKFVSGDQKYSTKQKFNNLKTQNYAGNNFRSSRRIFGR